MGIESAYSRSSHGRRGEERTDCVGAWHVFQLKSIRAWLYVCLRLYAASRCRRALEQTQQGTVQAMGQTLHGLGSGEVMGLC